MSDRARLGLIGLAGLGLALVAGPASAQASDPRFLEFDGQYEGIFHIATGLEATQVVLFGQGEQVLSVIVSDPRAYAITVSADGESLALRAVIPNALAMLAVRTSKRSYDLELSPTKPGGRAAPVIRFATLSGSDRTAFSARPALGVPEQVQGASWQLAGSKALRPLEVIDDGERTYITFGDKQPIPAVFTLGASGDEQTIDGYMREGRYTIDRLCTELVFRIDKASARARRIAARGDK